MKKKNEHHCKYTRIPLKPLNTHIHKSFCSSPKKLLYLASNLLQQPKTHSYYFFFLNNLNINFFIVILNLLIIKYLYFLWRLCSIYIPHKSTQDKYIQLIPMQSILLSPLDMGNLAMEVFPMLKKQKQLIFFFNFFN